MKTLICIAFSLFALAASAQEALITSDFNDDHEGWTTFLHQPKDAPQAEWLQRLAEGGVENSGCLQLTIPESATENPKLDVRRAGAMASFSKVEGDTTVRATFHAKAVGVDSLRVTVARPWGGSKGDAITVTGEWQAFTVDVVIPEHPSTGLVFSITADGKTKLGAGTILLDNVSLAVVPAAE